MASMSPTSDSRIVAIDWMRGFVMILMAIDHASEMWNAGRFNADSAYLLDPWSGAPLWDPTTVIAPEQFFTRWITHLCAPTFLFLSGTSLALSLEKRARAGADPRSLDRHLAVRALVILGFEGMLSIAAGAGVLILQVLFAIGASLLAMIALRRLSTRWLLAISGAWLAGGELITRTLLPIGDANFPLLGSVLLVPAHAAPVTVIYPLVHWLAMMVLGWAFGRALQEHGAAGRAWMERVLGFGGVGALVFFAVIRGLDSYGNMGLHRVDATWIRWLHVSKYPPALAFTALELGLMALCLVLFSALERVRAHPPSDWNPVLVFGQTALFFYVLHFLVLGSAAMALTGGFRQRGLTETYLAALGTLVVLYPVCVLYRAYKRGHPRSFAQYL